MAINSIRSIRQATIVICFLLAAGQSGFLQSQLRGQEEALAKSLSSTVAKGIEYLKAKGQADDGSFSGFAGIGPTALITTAMLRNGQAPTDPHVARSLKYLESFVQEGGGIHQKGTFYRNYETCLCIMCFSAANKGGKYDAIIKRADGFVKGIQWTEASDKTKSDLEYGGGGYGRDKRPDLSNTAFLIDALKAAGNDEDSEAIQRALVFISRCQNHESPHNTTEFSAKIDDGGFYYTPVGGGSSQAGKSANGGLRSYGAMTYAGLKSMLYAGVKPDDSRVKAATTWVRKHYDLKANPGLGEAGLYYYYHVFAKALHALGEETIVDDQGAKHSWKTELATELGRRQRADGSWVNSNDRWLEGDANLATGFALLALSYCK